MPERVQLKRTKGYRKPDGAVVVARPTKWGNPFKIGDPHPVNGRPMSRSETVELYRSYIEEAIGINSGTVDVRLVEGLSELRGHDLACWCPLDQDCHADVLLRIANEHQR